MSVVLQTLQDDPGIVSSCGYNECVSRLARLVDQHEDTDLEEVASLISQLLVAIEA
jgi:hypothetical protein